ncbi:fimbrial protein [Serratia fonticola]
MRIKKTTFIVFSCLFSQAVMATPIAEWGRVNMQGAIIDTACAIAVNSREQTIDMGTVPLADIVRDGQGPRKPFSIILVDCITERFGKEDWKQFQVTFDGESDGGLFGIHGNASGVALQIIDTNGNIAAPGKAMPLMDVIPGNSQLNYNLRLVSNSQVLKVGDYFSSIRFKLDYF